MKGSACCPEDDYKYNNMSLCYYEYEQCRDVSFLSDRLSVSRPLVKHHLSVLSNYYRRKSSYRQTLNDVDVRGVFEKRHVLRVNRIQIT